MAMEKKITVDKEISERLERLHYEYNALVSIETAYLDSHALDPNGKALSNPVFEDYHKRTVEAFAKYEQEKTKLIDKYDLAGSKWNLDFSTRELTVY